MELKWKPCALVWSKEHACVHGCVSTFRWACWQACIPVSFRGSTVGRHEDFAKDRCDQSCICVLFCCANQLCDCFERGQRSAPVSTGLSAPVSTVFLGLGLRETCSHTLNGSIARSEWQPTALGRASQARLNPKMSDKSIRQFSKLS